jgi:YggT family protein
VALGGLRISHPSLDLLNQLIRPVLEPFSRLLPPMGGIDLSPILLFLAIRVLQILVYNLADSAGVTPAVVIGI